LPGDLRQYKKLTFRLSHWARCTEWYARIDGIAIRNGGFEIPFNIRRKSQRRRGYSVRLEFPIYYRLQKGQSCGSMKEIASAKSTVDAD
jgi:hypothetical protein